ncbi:MAG: transketolase [Coriobacteriia bacterium]|nr:transketolase [Coriobacteriia bacterium]
MLERGFLDPVLDPQTAADLADRARRLRGAVLTMTALAESGHPGGSMSSLETYLLLYSFARLRPTDPVWRGRDRVVVSHGHTSPGVYAALADAGFFDLDDAVAHFRQAGSLFEGHVERSVPGVEWSTGNLGQGLSAGVGMALAARMTDAGWHTFVAMSDGEQNKGQVGEARRLAAKYRLCDLTVVVDLNRVQISGHTDDVMPVRVAEDFAADGWRVIESDGHDLPALYAAIAEAVADTQHPCAVLAHTTIGKGVSFMEDEPEFHGRGLTVGEYERAMGELGLDPGWLQRTAALRSLPVATAIAGSEHAATPRSTGSPRTYASDVRVDCRSAWGTALVDIAEVAAVPLAVLDCDLAESVKTKGFALAHPGSFIECGVAEHNAAAVAGALSANGVLTFWADFGVFGCDETYNQQRLNDINKANVKLVLTHCGLDVGEDGRTHQCLDYVGAFRDFFGWKVIVPADANQTDRVIRAAATLPGNVAVAMGRSKLAPVTRLDGTPLFGEGYEFRYGAIEWVRAGVDATVLAMGTVAGAVVEAADALAAEGAGVAVGIVACPLHLDDTAMAQAASAPLLVTAEDHGVRTGLGASVAEWLALNGRATRFVRYGVEGYASSGASADLLRVAGLDAGSIARQLREALTV